MKKILLLLFTLIALVPDGRAQTTGGPDAYGYVWYDSNDPQGPAVNWIDITVLPGATQVSGLADDNYVGPFLLPDSFPYYWYKVNKFWIGSNGYISFGATNFAAPFPVIPIPDTKNDFLAAMMTDLNFDGTGNPASCWYWNSPNGDTTIVSYIQVPFWQNGAVPYTGENTFQMILSYVDSSITFQYLTQNGTGSSTIDIISTGIENVSGQMGLMWGHDVYPPANWALRFVPPANPTLAINDASTQWNDNDGNGGIFLSRNGSGLAMKTLVRNSGNSTLAPFNVNSVVRNSLNQIQVNNTTATSGSLVPGQTELVVHANSFLPVNAGTFRFITDTQLGGDATPSNNQRILEVAVVDTTLNTIELSYDNGTDAGLGGIAWNGGAGGCANYFVPPFYPCDITATKAYITVDANAVGYSMMIVDDNGPNNSPGTVLDSVFVAPGTFTIGAFNTTSASAPVRIDSGGFYVTWFMAGDGVGLGQNQLAPISNRSFENLGGTYSDYRSREIEDLMIRAQISRVGVGLNDNPAPADGFGNVYPNPAGTGKVWFELNDQIPFGTQVQLSLYAVNGQRMRSENLQVSSQRLEINLNGLAAGLYTLEMIWEGNSVYRKIDVR